MSIRFSCPTCSKQLQAPDALAGKRVKCKGCATLIDLPAAPEAEAVYDAQLVEEAPTVLDAVLVEEAPGPRDEDPRPRRRDRDDRDDNRPGRKKKRSALKIILILGLVGCLFACLLGGGGTAVWYFAIRDRGLGGDLDYMPDGFTNLHAFNFDAVKAGPAFEKAKNCPGNKERYAFAKTPAGKQLDVTRALIGSTSFETITVLTFRSDVTIQDVVDSNVTFTETTVGNKKVYDTSKSSYCILGKRVVIGSNAGVRAVLQRNGKPRLTDTMRDTIPHVDFSRPEVTVMEMSQLGMGFVDLLQAMGRDVPVAFVVENDYEMPMNVSTKLICRDEKSAETIQANQTQAAPGMAKKMVVSEVKRKEKLVTVVGRLEDPCAGFTMPGLEP